MPAQDMSNWTEKEHDAYAFARERIAKAKVEGATRLNLSSFDYRLSQGSHESGHEKLRALCAFPPEIADLSALQYLDVSGTQITDLALLAGLKAMQSLDLSGTPVEDLTPLARLTALQHLNVCGTRTADLTPVRPLLSSLLQGARKYGGLDFSFTPVAVSDYTLKQVSELSAYARMLELQAWFEGKGAQEAPPPPPPKPPHPARLRPPAAPRVMANEDGEPMLDIRPLPAASGRGALDPKRQANLLRGARASMTTFLIMAEASQCRIEVREALKVYQETAALAVEDLPPETLDAHLNIALRYLQRDDNPNADVLRDSLSDFKATEHRRLMKHFPAMEEDEILADDSEAPTDLPASARGLMETIMAALKDGLNNGRISLRYEHLARGQMLRFILEGGEGEAAKRARKRLIFRIISLSAATLTTLDGVTGGFGVLLGLLKGLIDLVKPLWPGL